MAHEANKDMVAIIVSHGGIGEASVPKDIHMKNFKISMGGCKLVNEASVTLDYER
jgi:hypothetical protein